MDKEFQPVAQPHLWGNERIYIDEALESGWISSRGPFIERFEQAFAESIGTAHAISVTNCTNALHLALDALGIGPGDEVIVPDFTMIAPVFAILYQKATPVPVDADETWNMDPDAVILAITPQTRAVLAVHTYGHPARMDRLREIADKHNLWLIEDAAEAHGATVLGQPVGAFGDIACFSFYANKLITTGEGGMIITNHEDLAKRIRWKRDMCFGSDEESRYTHQSIGFNYRMTNLQAAVGLAQLENTAAALTSKLSIARAYDAALGEIPGLSLPPRSTWATNVFWVYGVLIQDEFGLSRLELQQWLFSRKIETRRFFTPLHRQPVMSSNLSQLRFPKADLLCERGLYLPSFSCMSTSVVERVAEEIRRARK
jgi:perosamine synthetase